MVQLTQTRSQNPRLATTLSALLAAVVASQATADVDIGSRAPGFTLSNAERGEQMTLSSYRGKTVVVEWIDLNCPAVQNGYKTGAIQALQKKYDVVDDARSGDDSPVAWLTIVITPPGDDTHVSEDVANEFAEHYGASPSHVLLDNYYSVGQTWSVNTVPKAFIVNDSGEIVYKGGLAPASDSDGEAANYKEAAMHLDKALQQTLNGLPIEEPTRPVEGCAVEGY